MSMTQFEAAARLDYEKYSKSNDVTEVVLDTDTLEVGICTFDSQGKVTLIGKTKSAADVSELQTQMLGGQSSTGIFRAEWEKELQTINGQLEKFYRSSEQMDSLAVNIPALGIEWKCSKLHKQFSGIKRILTEAFEEADEILSKNNIDEDRIRIILIGEWANYYMFLYTVKEYFTFDPFMEDNRFAKETICRKGTNLVAEIEKKDAEAETIGYDIGLKFFELLDNEDLEEKIEWFSKKTQPVNHFKQVHYSTPFYVNDVGSLEIQINGKTKLYAIPFKKRSGNAGVAEAGLIVENQKIKLRVRRIIEPEKVYDINLDLR